MVARVLFRLRVRPFLSPPAAYRAVLYQYETISMSKVSNFILASEG